MVIKQSFTIEDLISIAKFEKENTKDFIKQFIIHVLRPIIRSNGFLLVNEDNGKLNAYMYATSTLESKQMYFHYIFVDPEYRGMGIGKRIHNEAEKAAAKLDIETLICTVKTTNVFWLEFLINKKQWFIYSVERNSYGYGENRFLLKKILNKEAQCNISQCKYVPIENFELIEKITSEGYLGTQVIESNGKALIHMVR